MERLIKQLWLWFFTQLTLVVGFFSFTLSPLTAIANVRYALLEMKHALALQLSRSTSQPESTSWWVIHCGIKRWEETLARPCCRAEHNARLWIRIYSHNVHMWWSCLQTLTNVAGSSRWVSGWLCEFSKWCVIFNLEAQSTSMPCLQGL